MRPSTFSIVALDPATGEVGVAVASKFLAVGAAVPWAQAGAGAIATQAWANLRYGPDGLALLAQGASAEEVVRRLTEADADREHRQLGVVDCRGGAAAWTGGECFRWAGHRTGAGYTCQGNILVGESVVAAMAETFERTAGALPERLLAALDAGEREGGDSRGRQSAALYVAKEKGGYGGATDRYIDLRVDDHPVPVTELRRLLEMHRLYFGATEPANLTRLAGNVAKEVQEILRRLGFYQGEITGVYDLATKEAFRRYCAVENFEERWREDHFVDREILNFMRARHGGR
ncbi:MAG TPA: DUF1028 domain-containing protein [bacterium]|nr:DUF1028 domain-containing protein [bacterium]